MPLLGTISNVAMAERQNTTISFIDFFKMGFPLMLFSIMLATGYITAWYLLDKPGVMLVTSAIGILMILKLMEENTEPELQKRHAPAGETSS